MNYGLIQQEYGFLGDKIHINACSVGVPPARTQKAAESFIEHYLPLVYDSNNCSFEWLRQKVREELADLINGHSDEIAFTKNTTEGTATLAWGYPLKSGDNVVVCDLENHSNLYPWLYAAEKKGYEVKVIKTDGRSINTEEYLEAIDSNTKIVAVSAVQAGCGARIDLAKLGKVCREKGIVLSVDAIQALGRLYIDVQDCCVDYLTCGGFKALGAGFGIGFVYCRKEIAERIDPLIVGDGGVIDDISAPEVYTSETEMEFYDGAERFEGGSSNAMGIWLLHHSLSLLSEIGKTNINDHVLRLEALLRNKISDCGLDVLPQCDLPSGVVVAWYPKEHFESADVILKKYNLHITHHAGYLRLSIAMHNSEEQMEMVAEAFKEIGNLKGERLNGLQ